MFGAKLKIKKPKTRTDAHIQTVRVGEPLPPEEFQSPKALTHSCLTEFPFSQRVPPCQVPGSKGAGIQPRRLRPLRLGPLCRPL